MDLRRGLGQAVDVENNDISFLNTNTGRNERKKLPFWATQYNGISNTNNKDELGQRESEFKYK